jgi:hypothetical protein
MIAPWLTFLAIIAMALVYVVLPIMADAFARFRRKRVVYCTEEGRLGSVRLDATLAALTAVPGPPKLRVERCSFWPDRADCAQRCTRQLV